MAQYDICKQFHSLAHIVRRFNYDISDDKRCKYYILAYYYLGYHDLLANHIRRSYNYSKDHYNNQQYTVSNDHVTQHYNLLDYNVCCYKHDPESDNHQHVSNYQLSCDDNINCYYHIPWIIDD